MSILGESNSDTSCDEFQKNVNVCQENDQKRDQTVLEQKSIPSFENEQEPECEEEDENEMVSFEKVPKSEILKKINKKKMKKKMEHEKRVDEFKNQILNNSSKLPTTEKEFQTLENLKKLRAKRDELVFRRTGKYQKTMMESVSKDDINKFKKQVKKNGPASVIDHVKSQVEKQTNSEKK